ncbi:hypothetical protein JQS43_05370 [Natronosporangium hydrolyticum]|uniref:Uncharacterized protein n=1 Tax=Natronosporangium hydrolyticum TaxID=2811111 RepID=A0A895YNR7_9ACTN|nr:permease prefix domain 1-containing protein [Natronosporangium hydrolyticum]QSB15770.1 hypothetical protein JQS43_05370 [Natronosporangium hydrolyticum]
MDVIEAYLDRLSRSLVGPGRCRRDLVAEARDGLVDAAEAYQRAGTPEGEARRRAVADFGSSDEIAAAFQTELALSQARRAVLLAVALLTAQPLLWQAAGALLLGSGTARWPGGYAVLDQVLSWLGTATVLAAVAALVASGAATRRWAPAALARGLGWAVLTACVVFGVLGAAMTVVAPGGLVVSVALSVGLLLVPLLVVARSARRALVAG